jgi:glycosyltransferase involved in cell wall biosynthesis
MSRAQVLGVISENIGITIQTEYDLKADDRWQRMLVGMNYRPEACVKPTYDQLFVIDQRLTEIPQQAFKVLFIGRLEMRKGIDILLNAAWDVLKHDKECYFIIAGRNSHQWQSYVREKLGETYQDHFVFLDEIPLEKKDPLYAFSDVVTFPSRFESFGMVGLETTVHGKPIIAAEAGGIPEVVTHEVNGMLFPVGDTEALSMALLRLKNDKALYQKLAAGAKAKRQILSARNMAMESLEHYKKLIPDSLETLHCELEVNA